MPTFYHLSHTPSERSNKWHDLATRKYATITTNNASSTPIFFNFDLIPTPKLSFFAYLSPAPFRAPLWAAAPAPACCLWRPNLCWLVLAAAPRPSSWRGPCRSFCFENRSHFHKIKRPTGFTCNSWNNINMKFVTATHATLAKMAEGGKMCVVVRMCERKLKEAQFGRLFWNGDCQKH